MPILKINLDKGSESFYVFEMTYAGDPDKVATFEDDEGKGPWYFSDEEYVNNTSKMWSEQYGITIKTRAIQVWI